MQRVSSSWLLSVILPGLGHMLWGEYLFGLFVFLIMLLAVGLACLGVLVGASSLYYWGLMALPILFFGFSLLDLKQTVEKRRGKYNPTTSRALLFLAISLAVQFGVPGTPARFLIDNRPSVFQVENNDLSPLVKRGDLAWANSMAYYTSLFFYDRPVYHSMPDRFDLVRFKSANQRAVSGVVIGLTKERVEVTGGEFVINGVPLLVGSGDLNLSGDCPLTLSGPYSILVAELHLGRIKRVHKVPLFELVGKVSPLL